MISAHPERPGEGRSRQDAVIYEFTVELLPPGVDPYEGKRIGRPERSPTLPPPDGTGEQPAPEPPAAG